MKAPLPVAMKSLTYPGETDCGDQLDYWQDEKRLSCCVVDGLGHGSDAKQAASNILQYVAAHRFETPEKLFRGCDAEMRHQRGGVAAVAWIESDCLTYAAVGNITGYLAHIDIEPGIHRLEHLNMDRGMISGGFRRLNVQVLRLTEGDLLIMHSDGLNEFFNLEPWQAFLDNSEKLAQALLGDQSKKTDDACVLVYRHGGTDDER